MDLSNWHPKTDWRESGRGTYWHHLLFEACDDPFIAAAATAQLQPAMDAFPDETLDLLCWSIDHGFFESPASTRFHLCEPGGLVVHSASTTEIARKLARNDGRVRAELGMDADYAHADGIVAVCAFFHDICKAGLYRKLDAPNPKTGALYGIAQERSYTREHGELSRYRIRSFYGDRIPSFGYDAIEWHMGEFDWRLKKTQDELSEDEADHCGFWHDSRARYESARKSAFVRLLHEADIRSTKLGL